MPLFYRIKKAIMLWNMMRKLTPEKRARIEQRMKMYDERSKYPSGMIRVKITKEDLYNSLSDEEKREFDSLKQQVENRMRNISKKQLKKELKILKRAIKYSSFKSLPDDSDDGYYEYYDISKKL
jgi:hypothetical protein